MCTCGIDIATQQATPAMHSNPMMAFGDRPSVPCARAAIAFAAPTKLTDGREVVTPIVPVVIGEDWQAVTLWRALFDAGIYTNVAIHPAVPPSGALLRTSLMATHEREHLDRALTIMERVLADFPDLPRAG